MNSKDRSIQNQNFFDQFKNILIARFSDSYLEEYSEQTKVAEQIAEEFAEYLRASRTIMGLSQRELAEKANLSEAELIALEHGIILPHRIENELLCVLAKVLGIDVQEFADILGREIPKFDQKNGNPQSESSLVNIVVKKDDLEPNEDLEEIDLLLQKAGQNAILKSIKSVEPKDDRPKSFPMFMHITSPIWESLDASRDVTREAWQSLGIYNEFAFPFFYKDTASDAYSTQSGSQYTPLLSGKDLSHGDLNSENILARKLKALYKAGKELTAQIKTPENTVKLIGEQVKHLVECHHLFVAYYDGATKQIRFPVYIEQDEQRDYPFRLLQEDSRDKPDEIILTQQPILQHTKQEAQAWYNEPGRKNFSETIPASWLGVPMIVNSTVIGIIAVYNIDLEYAYNQTDLELSTIFAGQAATALENAQLHAQLEHQGSVLATLHRATEILAAIRGIRAVLDQIVKQAQKVLLSDSAVLYLYDRYKDEYYLKDVITTGIPAHEAEYLSREYSWRYALSQTINQGWVVVTNIEDSSHFSCATKKLLRWNGVYCFLGVAIAIDNETFGVLYVNYNSPFNFDEEDRMIAQTFANYAELCLRNVTRQSDKLGATYSHPATRNILDTYELEDGLVYGFPTSSEDLSSQLSLERSYFAKAHKALSKRFPRFYDSDAFVNNKDQNYNFLRSSFSEDKFVEIEESFTPDIVPIVNDEPANSINFEELANTLLEKIALMLEDLGKEITLCYVESIKGTNRTVVAAYPPRQLVDIQNSYTRLRAPRIFRIIGRAIQTGQTQLVNNVSTFKDPDYQMLHPKTRSQLAIPLKDRDCIFGVLNIEISNLDGFDETDVDILEGIATQAVTVLQAGLKNKSEQTSTSAITKLIDHLRFQTKW